MNTKLVNSAAGVINAALTQDRTAAGISMALESAQLLMTPETAAEHERLRAEVAALREERPITNEALDDAVRSLREPLTVYRASHDSIVMGLYTTASEARAHCVAEERRTWSKGAAPVFDWIEDEDDGVAELVTMTEDGETETVTGYVVTALEVAAQYDAEADE